MSENEGKTVIIIPARMASNRLPGKPLCTILGKTLLEWTYLRAAQAAADHVLVVTPDREIVRCCRDHKMMWWPSSPDVPSGTHRCAAAVSQMKEKIKLRRVINWQVDEPLVPVSEVNRLLSVEGDVATVCAPAETTLPGQFQCYDNVKVAVGRDGSCHWFSRAPMAGASLHCGVYSFDPAALYALGKIPPSDLSTAESLEQLTWIEAGASIKAITTSFLPHAVNREEDLVVVEHLLLQENKQCPPSKS